MYFNILSESDDMVFSHLKDTIMALQALAKMASLVYSKDFNANVTVTGPPESNIREQFTVDTNNALVLQSREVL